MKKYLPFNSKYLPHFQVVEQREGTFSRFPHTDQLPKLLRALTFEFEVGLPDKIARVAEAATDFMKMQRYVAAVMFCGHINKARRDEVRLQAIVDKHLVARIAIVQQVIEHAAPAPIHRFKFYGGSDFIAEIHLNGKQIAFADHAIERFSERVPNRIGEDLTTLFKVIFNSPAIVMECNKTPAFVYPYEKSIIAFPVRQSDTIAEYFIPTCLTGRQVNQLEPIIPPPAYSPLYDKERVEPKVRNWDPIQRALTLEKIWRTQEEIKLPEETIPDSIPWSRMGHHIKDILKSEGHGEGSRILFRDNIRGHNILRLKPGEEEKKHVEIDDLKQLNPIVDWEKLVPDHRAANPDWYGAPQTGIQV